MPAIASGKVLVTGANGYVAVWIVKSLLDAGYAVRGVVRSEKKGVHLQKIFKPFGDNFEIAIVPDITDETAFGPLLEDVDAVLHTASPVDMTVIEPDDFIVPAVQGTTSVLKATATHGTRVRRVIVLSSTAAILHESATPMTFDESSWNDQAVAETTARGRDAPAIVKYRASKTLAERAAWKLQEDASARGDIQWDLVTLNPPFVFGPVLHEVDKPENLNFSAKLWYDNVVGGASGNDTSTNFVDVRDVAQAHVLALQKPEAGGNRFIIANGPFKWQDFVSAAHRLSEKIPPGNISYDPAKAEHHVRYENAKSVSVLGMKYRSVDELTSAALDDFKGRGWM
ncbi:NAD(P)-binding protein [Epithele typhae]|uniref:NAD(P)-binding protein n=1 Tax=Epithele typhae TaxID=378194 RepID=UPI002007F06E|nr:NAD(P)-binding protein [Epithele typhae]KAH9918248.1 NAD(P)-binding protein [Epithele typhae]